MNVAYAFLSSIGETVGSRLILLALAKKPQKTAETPQFRFRNLRPFEPLRSTVISSPFPGTPANHKSTS